MSNTDTLQDYYNKENKLAWLDTLDKKDNYFINSIFSSARIHEENNQTDLCNFTKGNILSFYTGLMSINPDRLNNINSFLKTYTDWCLLNELVNDGQNHYIEVTYNDLIQCVNKNALSKSYITEEDLINWSNGNDIKGMIVNPCDLAVIWLLFEGVRGAHYKEIMDVEYSDFNIELSEIKLSTGRNLKISEACLNYIMKTKEVGSYVLPSLRELPFIDDKILRSYRKDQLDRDTKNVITNVSQLNRRITKALKDLNMDNCSLNSIIISGQIAFIKQLAKEKKISVEEYVKLPECYQAVAERYGVKTWLGSRFYASHKEQFDKEG